MNEFLTAIKSIDFEKLTGGKRAKQISSLYISTVLGIVIGIGISVVNTRLLGPQQFGDLKFLQNLFAFVVTFLTLGLFTSGSMLIAQKKNEKLKHQIIGNLLAFAALISIVLIIGLFSFSFIEERIFNNQLGEVIRIFSPLLFVFPFQLCLENIMQGDNRIYELSIFRIGPKILYLIVAIAFNYFIPLSLSSALAIQFFSVSLLIFIMIIHFKPKFENLKRNISYIWRENKYYGFQVYIGGLVGVASVNLGALSIGYFINNSNVGFFSLAVTITMPLASIPRVMGTTFFKKFATVNQIPKKVYLITLLLSVCALLLFIVIIKNIILFLYSSEYKAVIPLAYIVAIGSVFHGGGDFINRFLGAHGKGRELRNGAIGVGISNILGYVLLVYGFGIIGAAITKLIAGLTYLSMMYYYYKNHKK